METSNEEAALRACELRKTITQKMRFLIDLIVMKSKFLYVFFVILIVALFFAKKKVVSPPSSKPTKAESRLETAAGAPATKDKTTSSSTTVQAQVTNRPAAKSEDSFFCSRVSSQNLFMLSDYYLPQILKDMRGSLLLPEREAACLKESRSYYFTFVSTEPLQKIAYRTLTTVNADIKKIHPVYSMKHVIANYQLFNYKSAQEAAEALNRSLTEFFAPLNGQDLNFAQVDFSISGSMIPSAQGPARPHPYATTITGQDLSRLRQGKVVIIDTRFPNDAKGDAIADSVNMPIRNDLWNNYAASYSDLQGQPVYDQNLFDSIPKEAAIVALGYPRYFAAYNVLTFLAAQGRRNLYYLPEGVFTLRKIDVQTPESYGIPQITSQELSLQLKKVKYLVDVRNARPFKTISIAGATNVEYRNRSEDRNQSPHKSVGYLIQKEKQDEFKFEKLGDVPKSELIVLYGVNKYDFRPLKAAIFLKEQGFRNVRWYRSGSEEWLFLRRIFPDRYPVRAQEEGS